jgi:integrase
MPITKTKRINKDGSVTIGYRADAGADPVTGKRRRKRFKKWNEADRWEKQQYASDQTDANSVAANGVGGAAASAIVTLKELGAKHVADRKKAGRERGTWQKYEEHFDVHLTAIVLTDGDFAGCTLRDVPIARLRPRHFMQLKADLVATRSHAMALKIWSTLRAALDYAVAMEMVEFNAAASIKIDRQPRIAPEDRVPIPTKPDIALLHQALQPRPMGPNGGQPLTFGQAFVLTTMSSGMRPGEMRALAWSNLAIEAAPFGVNVVERVDSWNQPGAPKSAAGARYVPLPPSTAKLLREWKLACPKSPGRDLVFPTAEGHYQHPANLQNRIWVPLQLALGLREPIMDPETRQQAIDADGALRWTHRYVLYALRHAYASIQIELGIQPKTLQQRMGHASIQVTLDTYGHLWRDHGRDAADMSAIEAWFAGLPRHA